MAIASASSSVTVTVTVTPKARSSSQRYEVDRVRKLKLMRLEPEPTSLNETVDNQTDATPTATATDADGFSRVSSESLQLVLGFLTPHDRLALLSTHRKFQDEPLATSVTSFCGRCSQCDARNQHLCENPCAETSAASFWTALLRRSRVAGLTQLQLANCDAFSATTLWTVDASTRAKSLSKLKTLEFNRCMSLGADGMELLAESCSSLQELRLRDMPLDADAFAQLVAANKSTLRVVDLEGCHTLTATAVSCLKECPRLESLGLAGCYNVDNASIADIARACPKLQAVNLRFCHRVDDVLVEKIAGALPKLKELDLRYCMKVTDAAVHVICDRLAALHTLDLSHCSKITDASVGRIVDSLTSLKDLRLWACGKLTTAAVQAISEAAPPSLETVDIRSRDRAEAVIGGRDALQMLVRKRSRSSLSANGRWESAGPVGVFKRLPTCAVAA